MTASTSIRTLCPGSMQNQIRSEEEFQAREGAAEGSSEAQAG